MIVIDKTIAGFVYSFITPWGDEKLVMSSFGTTKTKSKKAFNYQNQERKEKIDPYKRYSVHVQVMEEV
jgi:hypothetical protein